MLKHISSIWEYRDFLSSQETHLDSSQFKRLNSSLFRSALHKLRKLDPGLVSDLLCSLYSAHGRPAIDPAVLIRSFVLMQHLKYTSIHSWCEALHSDTLLQYLIGSFFPPTAASHYDFIIRLTGKDPHLKDLYPKDHYKKPDPKSAPKKGEKLINYSHVQTVTCIIEVTNSCSEKSPEMVTFSKSRNHKAIPWKPGGRNDTASKTSGTKRRF